MSAPAGSLMPNDRHEWSLQFDMRERGRRLTAFKDATAGKVLVETAPGIWQYVPQLAAD